MRLIVIGALVVAALAIALLVQVTGHTEPASTPSASVGHATTPQVSAGSATPPSAPTSVEAHARGMPATRAAPTLAPAMPAPTTDPAKPKHVDTPTDILRWSLMRAVRTSEPGVIDCLDKARATGTTIDGRAVFAFYVTATNGKAVISRASVDTSPFPDAVNTCIRTTLSTGELDQPLPEGQTEFRVLRELVVDKNAITQYKLKSFLTP